LLGNQFAANTVQRSAAKQTAVRGNAGTFMAWLGLDMEEFLNITRARTVFKDFFQHI